jgi:hypothetical protein
MGLTTEGGKVLTTRDAEGDQQNFRRENGQGRDGRYIHPIPDWLATLQEKKVHIINVGPWKHEVWAGSYGKFTIWPNQPGEETPWQFDGYSLMLEFDPHRGKWMSPVSSVMAENVIKNEAEMERQTEDGYKFAAELLGDGRGQNSAFSLRHRGCLVIKGEKPTKTELTQANESLHGECMRLVQEARDLARDPNPLARQAIVKGVHDEAAMILGLEDEDWMVARNPQARKSCKLCGTKVEGAILKCPNCPYIFDPVAYGEIMAEQDAQIDKARGKGKKPAGPSQG